MKKSLWNFEKGGDSKKRRGVPGKEE